jgi:hypothetical protein
MQLNRRAARPFITALAFFSFLTAIGHGPDTGPDTGPTLKSDAFRMARAVADDCQRSLEEIKEKF